MKLKSQKKTKLYSLNIAWLLVLGIKNRFGFCRKIKRNPENTLAEK